MAQNLYFEVGVKDATGELNEIQKKLDKFVSTYEDKMQIKIRIENLEAFVNALKSIGNGDQLKPLLDRIDTMQRRLASMGDKDQYLDNLRREAAEAAKAVEIAEKQLERIKKTGNTNLIASAKLDLQNAQKNQAGAAEALASATERIKKEEEQLIAVSKENVAATEQSKAALKDESNAAQEAVNKLNKLVVEKQQVVNAEKNLADKSEKSSKSLKQEGEQAGKTSSLLEKVSKAAQNTADASQNSSKRQSASVDSLLVKYRTLIQRIENWQGTLSKMLDAGGHSNYFDTQLKAAIKEYQELKDVLSSVYNGKAFKLNGKEFFLNMDANTLSYLRSVMTYLGTSFANVNKEAALFNKASDQANRLYDSRMKSVDALDKKLSRMEARKIVDFAGIDTSKLDLAINKIRTIREELANFARTGTSTYGNTPNEIMRTMGLDVANREYALAVKELNKAKSTGAAATSRLTSEEQKLAAAINRSSQEMKGQSQVMSDLKMLATQYLGVWGAQSFLQNIIQIGGQLEMQRLSIGAILGDMAKASELFDRIKNLAIKSPFGVVELDQMTKQLSAYGFQYPELFDMTKRLADISAATGTSVDRLALALGHVRSEAALSGYTLRQFSMANIPLAKKLSEHLTQVEGKLVSIAEVRKRVRKKEIGYEDVLQVLKDLTDEGGMFYNAQEIMSESVKARFKNLKDSMDIMYNEIAESKIGDGLKEVAKILTVLTRHWQELGAVILTTSASWIINKTAMMASNKIMVQANLTMGRFSAAQLEMAAQTGNLTRAQLLQAVATKKLAVADAEAAGAVFLLSKAQLQHVANTGKTSAALNMATIATSKYTISQLRLLATMRSMNLGWLAQGFMFVTNGIKAASVAALGLVKTMWPLLALSAIVEVFMNWKREAEGFADAANYVGQSARNMMKDIDDAMKSVTKGGKPVNTEALRGAVNQMKELVENSEFYTAEQQKEVDKAVLLSEKYDILLKQMKEMRDEAEWQTNHEGLVQKILANTGRNIRENTTSVYNSQTNEYENVKSQTFGTRFFNNNLQENIQKINSSNTDLQNAINLLSEYQGVMNEAIKKNNNFGLSLDGKSWQEQIRMIANSGKWDEFISSVENAGSRFQKTADNVKKASDKVRDDWKSIVNDDVKAIRLTLMEEWGMTESELNEFAKNNEKTMRWLVDMIAKSLSKLGVAEAVIDEFKQKLLELFGVASSGKPTKHEPTEYEKQTDLGKRLMRNIINRNKNNGRGGNGVTTVKEINDITGTGENQKSIVEVTKTLKERAQKSLENMNETKKIYGETSKEYIAAKKKWEHDLNLAESNGITEADIRSGKYKDKSGSKEDKDAKILREKVRILKEAADSYKYWKKAVGEGNAFSHVNDEFGGILGEQGFKIEDAKNLEGTLTELREKYIQIYEASGKKRPKLLEAIKEIDKELAQLDRFDFEKKVEKFVSQMTFELDKLSRAFDIFNSVREATGDTALAQRLTGISPGATPADLKRYYISSSAGKAIDFESVLGMSDDDIDRYVESLGVVEEKIQAIQNALKDWKKAEQDVYKSDIQNYAKWLGSLVDLETKRKKNLEEYKRVVEETNRLMNRYKATNGKEGITEAEGSRRITNAGVVFEKKNWEDTEIYKRLYSNALGMAQDEFSAAYRKEMENLKAQMNSGIITFTEYNDKVNKLQEIQREFNNQGFLGIKGGVGNFLSGGISGLIGYYRKRQKDAADDNNEEESERYKKMADKLEQVTKAADQLVQAFNDISLGADMVAGMFDSLGMEGEANALSDAAGVVGGIGKGAAALSSLGPWGMAAGAMIGGISSIAQLNDKKHERRIEELRKEDTKIDNTLKTIKSLRERELGYDTGVLRKQLADQYQSQTKNRTMKIGHQTITIDMTPAMSGMAEYYGRYSGGNGYSQELNAMKATRKNYMEMYEEENAKKKKSKDALEEYKQKIAELDEQIMYFAQDLAKELWGIDIKGWANQISDAIWTAFENGEDAVKAFGDTAKSIVSSVAKNMMLLSIIEPMFQQLQKELFGTYNQQMMRYEGGQIKYDSNGTIDVQGSEQGVLEVLGRYFGKGGSLEKNVEAAEIFYKWVEKITGMDLSSDENKTGVSTSIKNITESTGDLLASYINATRASVSKIERMDAEYYPMYLQLITSCNLALTTLQTRAKEIADSNAAIERNTKTMADLMSGLKNKTWRVPIA